MPVIPQRPLLAPWYRIVGDGERLLLEHGQRVVVLEGAAVKALLPGLLPLLDGTRTVEELVEQLGAPARGAIENALTTLTDNGLVTDGPDAPPERRSGAHAVAASFGMTPSEAVARLDAAVVAVLGSARTGVEVARLVRAEGVGAVERLAWGDATRADLVVAAPAAHEHETLVAWNRHALDVGIRWLLVLPFDGRFAAVGPLVVPDETCCFECVRLRRGANVEWGDDLVEIDAAPVAARGGATLELLSAAVAAHLTMRWVVGHDTTVAGVMYAVETNPVLTVSEHPVLRVPRCPACSPAERQAAPLPWHPAEAA